MGQVWSTLAKFGPSSTHFGATSANCCLIPTEFGPTSGRVRPHFAEFRHTWSDIGQTWPTSTTNGLLSPTFGPSSIEFERCRPSVGRRRPTSGRNRPTSARVGPSLSEFGYDALTGRLMARAMLPQILYRRRLRLLRGACLKQVGECPPDREYSGALSRTSVVSIWCVLTFAFFGSQQLAPEARSLIPGGANWCRCFSRVLCAIAAPCHPTSVSSVMRPLAMGREFVEHCVGYLIGVCSGVF